MRDGIGLSMLVWVRGRLAVNDLGSEAASDSVMGGEYHTEGKLRLTIQDGINQRFRAVISNRAN